MRCLSLILLAAIGASTLCKAQDTCRLSDGSYWACAGIGSLAHVYPESTVVVKTGAEGFAMTAVHFDEACQRYGWACGADVKGHIVILRTIDGGRDWQPISIPALPDEPGNQPERIHSFRAYIVFVLFTSGMYLGSFDSGCTFNISARPVEGYGAGEARKRYDEMIQRFQSRFGSPDGAARGAAAH